MAGTAVKHKFTSAKSDGADATLVQPGDWNDDHLSVVPVYNVKTDYAAVGDGSNDDTAEIQGAIDAAIAAGGGIVYLPKGTYKITTLLTLGGNVTLRGAGKYATRIMATGCDGIKYDPVADPPNFVESQSNVVVEDLGIEGDYTSGKMGVQFANFRWWTLNRVRVANFNSHGMKFYETYAGTVRDCVVRDNDGNGMVFGGAANGILVVGGEINQNNKAGVSIDGTGYTNPVVYHVTFESVVIEGNCECGIDIVDNAVAIAITSCYLEANQTVNGSGSPRTTPTQPVVAYAIKLGSGGNTTITGTTVTGNVIISGVGSGATGYGFYLGFANGLVIAGNDINGTAMWLNGLTGWAQNHNFLVAGNMDGCTTKKERNGSSTFNGTTGRVITTNLTATHDQATWDYKVIVTPTATLAGRFYIVKADNQFTVYSTDAGDAGAFDWAIVADG